MTQKKTQCTRLALAACLAASVMVCGITQASAAAPASTSTPAKAVAPSSETYRPGQQWIVPGEWQFTVDAVRPARVNIHDDGGGSWQPTQVLLVSYSYRNIGFDDSANDKGGGPSTLAFSKAHIDVVDANDADNGGAGNYPVHLKLVEDADGQKIGQQMVGAQWPYAFRKNPKAVKVVVSHYDSRLQLQQATFIVPVKTTRQSPPHANRHIRHS
ncbi:hypothetical protein [Xanthomonas arboricola]|uniref:hypothetical protein n=1 Tax=Xanthomonas arboricola TaxID=56448 RepID=UPI001EE6C315|nr:hypothetical protein [Xanthomonas arboricola]